MADEPKDDELLLTEEAPKGEIEEEEHQADPPGDLGEEELEITFGDGAAPAPGDETGLVRHLRDELRERNRELADLRKQAKPQKIEVGPKPTLAGCDYDEERFEAERDAWDERRKAAEATESAADQQASKAREQWERELQSHSSKRAALRFADVDDVEAVATAALNEVQQAVIVKVAENSAQLLYALGKHPAKLAELSQITDPLKMAAAVARLEGGLKVMPRKRAPEPEEIASGTASISGRGTDKELERLEKEAEASGDRTKVLAYKRRLKNGS